MVMADDALSEKESEGWGGARQRKWHVTGKRAVVHVDAFAYEFIIALARACGRSVQDFNSQIYAAGLESLSGHSVPEICTEQFGVPMGKRRRGQKKALTHDEVREVAATFVKLVPEESDSA